MYKYLFFNLEDKAVLEELFNGFVAVNDNVIINKVPVLIDGAKECLFGVKLIPSKKVQRGNICLSDQDINNNES